MSKIVILNGGGQYCHLIARRIREFGVYAEIRDFNTGKKDFDQVRGIILSGGPDSVYECDSPKVPEGLFGLGIPVLGICYGHQLMAHVLGGKVKPGKVKEYGTAKITVCKNNSLFSGIQKSQTVWMSHGDEVEKLPDGFEVLASNGTCKYTAIADLEKKLYGLQFHPEVSHTVHGKKILKNFVFNICEITDKTWRPEDKVQTLINDIKNKAQGRKIIFLVSGGVDSTVAFALSTNALGKENVKGIYVDTGMMRKNETEDVVRDFKEMGMDNVCVVNAWHEFVSPLKDEYDPEKKRAIIGKVFVDIQNQEFRKMREEDDDWILGQGTIYPDTIESGCGTNASKIKTHHNRVNEILKLIDENRIIEPLAQFYKDEVRQLALALKMPAHMVNKEPFPGPGLAVRCICSPEEKEIKPDKKLSSLLAKYDLLGFVAPIKTVGVQGDFRSYRSIAIIHGNASLSKLEDISTAIVNSIPTVNRVAYIVASKEGVDVSRIRIHRQFIDEGRLQTLKEADFIVREFVRRNKQQLPDIWQFPVILFPLGYDTDEAIALRPVLSSDAMTAKFAKIKRNLLAELSQELLGLKNISTVLYDVTNKPPATIEWE